MLFSRRVIDIHKGKQAQYLYQSFAKGVEAVYSMSLESFPLCEQPYP